MDHNVIQSFREFIKQAPIEEGKKYCMVLDNAPWHKKAIRLIWTEERAEYQDIRDAMTYITLAPYSPDLNPIEQVWRITRREMTHNRYFSSKSLLQYVFSMQGWYFEYLIFENIIHLIVEAVKMSLAYGLALPSQELSVRFQVSQPALICSVRFTQVEPSVRVNPQ